MWFWVLLIAAGLLASEAFLRLPLVAQLQRMSSSARKSGMVLRSKRISDHWKETILPAYAWRLGKASVTFFVLMCLGLLPVVVLGLLFPGGLHAWGAALMRPMAIVVLCAVSLGYVWLRLKAGKAAQQAQATAQAQAASGSAAYSGLDRVLHKLALGSPAVAEMTNDIEKAMYLKSAPEPGGGPVFVTGLARAGSTALMREIYSTGQFGSLTYADMPFVLAPNLWHRLSRRGQTPGLRAERAHGDGIEVDTQSPEALDEVYWRVFDGKSYIGTDGLSPHAPGGDLIDGYRDLMRLVMLRTGTRRYLSKTNNTILRLPTLAAALPDARFLVPLRDPLAHAQSLLSQHRRFLDADAFTRDYMTWLGHHEFGATHRPFLFDGRPAGDPATLDYWLNVWIAAHAALDRAEAGAANVIFVPHEDLGRNLAMWPAVAGLIGVVAGPMQEVRASRAITAEAHDSALAADAAALHARLHQRAMQKLGLI